MSVKTDTASTDFAFFLLDLEHKYQVSLDEVLDVVARFGMNKGKIRGFFEVQSFLKKATGHAKDVNEGMVHNWFPF